MADQPNRTRGWIVGLVVLVLVIVGVWYFGSGTPGMGPDTTGTGTEAPAADQ